MIILGLVCSRCDEETNHLVAHTFTHLQELLQNAKKEGWNITDSSQYCPKCALGRTEEDGTWQEFSNPDHQQIAEHRFWVIKPLVTQKRTKGDVERRVEEVKEHFVRTGRWKEGERQTLDTSVSVSTIYRWLKMFDASSYGDWRALISEDQNRGAPFESRFHDDVEDIIYKVITESSNKRGGGKIDRVWSEVVTRMSEQLGDRIGDEKGIRFPSRSTIARRIQSPEFHRPFRNYTATEDDTLPEDDDEYPF